MREQLRSLVRVLGRSMPALACVPSPRREILVLRPDHLGDAILSLPALRYLYQSAPEFRLTLLIGPWNNELLVSAQLPAERFLFPFPGFTRTKSRSFLRPYAQLASLVSQLRRRAPLAALILRDDHWWGAWVTYLAGVPIRVGADHPTLRSFLTHPVELRSPHVAAQSVELVHHLLAVFGIEDQQPLVTPTRFPLNWPVHHEARREAEQLRRVIGLTRPFVIVHPGTGARAKSWPQARWSALVDALHQRQLPVILTGSSAERTWLHEIAQRAQHPPPVLAGMLSLAALAEIMRDAALVIGPDTGPLHLAVAVGTPTVHLFGPTNPERFGPWGSLEQHRVVRARLSCPSCGNISARRSLVTGCMMALTLDTVVQEIDDLLAQHSTRMVAGT